MKIKGNAFCFVLITFMYISLASAQSPSVSKTNPTKIYMHYMPWFDGPENTVDNGVYGWGWHWTMNNKNPNTILADGKRQVASHYYPLIGPYASKDPHVIEYHLLLMKYAGIDGVLIDWYGNAGSNGDVNSLLVNSNALINKTQAFGLDFALILEDRFWSTLSQARGSVAYAKNNYFNKPNYIRWGESDAPLVGIFGPITYQQESQWTDILSYAGEDVEFITLWYESSDAGNNADGEYAWIYEDESKDDFELRLKNFYQTRAGSLKTVMGVAYPGFKDFYKEGGAGNGYFVIDETENALVKTVALYDEFKSKLNFLQLATFNDFGEGTMFEPTVEHSFKYLSHIQQYAGVPFNESDLKNILRLYTMRKRFAGLAEVQTRLDAVAQHFMALENVKAVTLMNAIQAEELNSDITLSLPGKIEAEHYSAMEGVQPAPAIDMGRGLSVGWIDKSDWMDYQVQVAADETLNLTLRVASLTGGILEVSNTKDQRTVTITIPPTGGIQQWASVLSQIDLSKGEYVLRLKLIEGDLNINWFEFGSAVGVISNSREQYALWPTIADAEINLLVGQQFHTLKIIDIKGSVHHTQPVQSSDSTVVNISHLTSGIYVAMLIGNVEMLSLRFIKR